MNIGILSALRDQQEFLKDQQKVMKGQQESIQSHNHYKKNQDKKRHNFKGDVNRYPGFMDVYKHNTKQMTTDEKKFEYLYSIIERDAE